MNKEVKILQIEDNPDDAMLIARCLHKYGYQLDTLRVENGAELEDALARQDWDIVLSDYSLPGFDGLSALKIVNDHNGNLPFIMVSGAVGETTAVEIIKSGAKDFITKNNLDRLGPVVERELREVEVHRDKKESEIVLQTLMKSLASATGYESFHNIITEVCEWLGFEHGFIGRLLKGGRIETLANYIDRQRCSNLTFKIAGTPCSVVMDKGMQVYSGKVCQTFPHSNMLAELSAESYVGFPLIGRDLDVIGMMFFISGQKITVPGQLAQVLDIVAAKAASELERLTIEEEREKLEEQLQQSQKMEAIGTMAGGIAHDFNNILTGIFGYAEMAKRELADSPAIQDKIDKVLQAGHRARELVRQILTFSRHRMVD